ncbi:MAG TPA: glycosyltransferase [Pyrinomonadaceae bacterium]|nr:glycosyltransferase [Pyrinomonadaceae bacterium]
MRILLSADHRYPASQEVGSGLHPKSFPSGSAYMIHDLLARGLAELGHEVFYLLPAGADKPLPPGVTLVSQPHDADILHTVAYHDEELIPQKEANPKPWVTTCHLDLEARGQKRSPTTENWIFVSRTLAELHGRQRFVLNGIDPAAYIYAEMKEDYFLFMSAMDWGIEKGIETALSLSQEMGFPLVVAGTATNCEIINRVSEMCRQANAQYLGDVRGKAKAELLAGAKGFLFPTRVNEAFGLGIAEALMSGTPVICSDKGACPELVSNEVGFVCGNNDDFKSAISDVGKISSRACREKALQDFHYLRMTADYLAEYKKEIGGNGDSKR